MAKSKHMFRKPISFDTTIRNPERIPQFLSILKLYEGKILTIEIALEIEAKLIINKIYEPTSSTLGKYRKEYSKKFKFVAEDQSPDAENKVKLYFQEWKSSDAGSFSLEKMIYLLKNTTQEFRQDSSMPGGWVSRFYTQFIFANELGFVHTEFDREIQFSENGNLMIHDYENGEVKQDFNETYETSAFLIAFSKYQINNPYRSNTIKVNFFVLLLNVIMYLREKYDRPGIHREDISFVIAWGNNNHEELAEYIYSFRKKFGCKVSEEIIYEYAMNLIDEDTPNDLVPASQSFIELKKKHYKFEKIIRETRDEVIRKLRMTRLISLRGNGNFIDIDTLNIDKVNYILENYHNNISFETTEFQKYLNYMGKVDENLIYPIKLEETKVIKDTKQRALDKWSKEPWDFLYNELVKSAFKNQTDNLILKEIKNTARFEFLVSIVLNKALNNAYIQPNYIVDDEGIPYSTAGGQTKNSVGADIDVFEGDIHAIVEPTISNSRSFQVEHEIPSIQEHVLISNERDYKEKEYINDWFAIFVAPEIVPAVGNRIDIVKSESDVDIYAFKADDFGEISKNATSINDFKLKRDYAKGRRIKKR